MAPSKTKSAALPLPTSSTGWLKEIALAYADAHGAIQFGPVIGMDIRAGDLFHMAPSVCLKFRGIKPSGAKLKKATEAALTSYVVTKEQEPEVLSRPHLAFAFCYLAAHFGLDIVTDAQIVRVMDFVVAHEGKLARLILTSAPGR